jgi:hypothetical protein
MLPVVLISAGIYGIIDKYDGFPERYPNLAEFNQELIIKYSKKNCFDKFNVGNCDECFMGIKRHFRWCLNW